MFLFLSSKSMKLKATASEISHFSNFKDLLFQKSTYHHEIICFFCYKSQTLTFVQFDPKVIHTDIIQEFKQKTQTKIKIFWYLLYRCRIGYLVLLHLLCNLKILQNVSFLIFLCSSWNKSGSHPLPAASGEHPGNHGHLQVSGERQQTQRGQRQRLPHPVVSDQLWAQEVLRHWKKANMLQKHKILPNILSANILVHMN